MIEKPSIKDEDIILALNKNYSIQASEIEFLPIGNDASAFAYRVEAKNQFAYFLKIKKGFSNLTGLFVPRLLKDNGVKQVIAPCPTNTQELSVEMYEFALILYPFLSGKEAMETGMTDHQWAEFGSTLRRVHDMKLPSHIARYIGRETFVSKCSKSSKELDERVNIGNYDDPYQRQLARFWKEKNKIIHTIIQRTENIGKCLQETDLEFILCHADIHIANILLTPEQDMFIVDWDDTLLAPKERDLMFVLEGDTIQTREEHTFFDGYRNVKINQLALAFYRYEWCMQEIGDFGSRVFLTKDIGERTKQES